MNKIEIKQIGKGQKKIIVVAAIMLAVFLLFWLFIYLPSSVKANSLKKELLSLEEHIKGIEKIIGNKPLHVGIALLRKNLKEFSLAFPHKEEECLRDLSNSARKFDIKMLSIKPQPKIQFIDENKKETIVEGKTLQKVRVLVKASGSYYNIVKYIENLRNLAAVASVDFLEIQKESLNSKILNIVLNIDFWLLS